jgi:hypothetical protein
MSILIFGNGKSSLIISENTDLTLSICISLNSTAR